MSRSRPRTSVLAPLACAAALSAAACEDGPVVPPKVTGCVPSDGPLPHETLSEYCFFEGDMKELVPAAGAYPYDVAAALWSDHAEKHRFIVLPEGQKVTFGDDEDWQYPIGTIMVKTFSFRDDFRDPASPRRTLETRLLILGEAGWTGEVYLWDDAQTEATRIVAGERVDVTYITEPGDTVTEEYIVPNQNQCKSCHERDDAMTFLGPFTHQLNRPVDVDGGPRNQLEYLAEQGLFDGEIPPVDSLAAFPDPFGDAPIDDRARAYLHANCSHCHRPGGGGGSSGLVLLAWEKDLAKNGACKAPAAAGQGTGGHAYDIVPGHPEDSIMIFRMSSTDPDIKMPELPNRVPDQDGVKLVSDWISSLEPEGCP
jgi:uncharacterized repeat protein (TIGR03806 family)